MTQAELLRQVFKMILTSKVCPETPVRDWIKNLLFIHKKGYLYASCNNGIVDMFACMYRISKLTQKTENNFPEKEKGSILYIPFFVSNSKDKFMANRLFKSYLNNHSEVTQIAFRERGKKLRRFKRVKGEIK